MSPGRTWSSARRPGRPWRRSWVAVGLTQPTRDEQLRGLGQFALSAQTVPEPERRAVIEGRLPSHEWPAR